MEIGTMQQEAVMTHSMSHKLLIGHNEFKKNNLKIYSSELVFTFHLVRRQSDRGDSKSTPSRTSSDESDDKTSLERRRRRWKRRLRQDRKRQRNRIARFSVSQNRSGRSRIKQVELHRRVHRHGRLPQTDVSPIFGFGFERNFSNEFRVSDGSNTG